MAGPTSKPNKTSQDSPVAVDALLMQLQHPQTALIEAIRQVVLASDPSISEGVKWNAPSFALGEYFATVHLRSKVGIGLILHLGAKKRVLPATGLQITDPDGLLKWLAADRAQLEFRDVADLAQKNVALQAVIRQWLSYL